MRGAAERYRNVMGRMGAIVACLTAMAMMAACGSDQTGASGADTDATAQFSQRSGNTGSNDAPANGKKAADVLETLAVKGRAPKTGYSRAQFGAAWADVDHNGCDTRNDILNRDMTDKTYKSGTHNCVVATGRLADPYTGKTIDFVRGQKTSEAVQIDHVVALSDAWQKGAQQLSAEQRRQLANDPYNLLAVDGPANQQKSDGDAATWLPINKSYRCAYVARQIGVKAKYDLWVTQSEHDAMAKVLASCPSQAVPDTAAATASAQSSSKSAAPSKSATPQQTESQNTVQTPTVTETPTQSTTTPDTNSGSDVYYQNCAAVRAAGKAPLYKGQPGYSTKLDRDGDGVACE